jgi:predicted O-methyltransferase YrrM
MEQNFPSKSVRFFPCWNMYDSSQVVGFLNMVIHILDIKSPIENWVELGSFIGESANMVLGFPNIKHIDCVDLSKHLITETEKRLNRFILNNRCSVHNKSSYDFLKQIPNNYMDVVYIDANHSYESVKQDIELSFEKLKNDSFLCGHDYNPEHKPFPESNQAIEEFSGKNGLEIIRFIDNSWIMRKT